MVFVSRFASACVLLLSFRAKMQIVTLQLPTPFPVGAVNVYLLVDDPITLVDAGPKTPEAHALLREHLLRAGFRLSDIKRLILTHTHEDHCGLARTILNESPDLEILVHAWETGHRTARFNAEANKLLLRRSGVGAAEISHLQKLYAAGDVYTDALNENEYRELADDDSIEFARGSLRVLHTPGHTPGSISLIRESDRTILAGDTVLKRITPNPILSPDPLNPARRFRSLEEYLVSLARLRSFAPTLIYGGHGEAVTDYEELFNRYLRLIRERGGLTLEKIEKSGSTAAEVATRMFPNANGIHRFLALSEACAHLDLLVSDGKLTVEIRDEIEFFVRQTKVTIGVR